MTRRLVSGGRAGTQVFPDEAQETARVIGLVEDEVQVGRYSSARSGGLTQASYDWSEVAVRGRIDPVGGSRGGGASATMAGQISEDSTHIVTLDDTVHLTTKDRVRVQGLEWVITAVRTRSDRAVTQVEVRQA